MTREFYVERHPSRRSNRLPRPTTDEEVQTDDVISEGVTSAAVCQGIQEVLDARMLAGLPVMSRAEELAEDRIRQRRESDVRMDDISNDEFRKGAGHGGCGEGA